MQKDRDDNGTTSSPDQAKPGEWTKKEMEEAEPAPMPEVEDEDDD